jgi:hypothetical protein
VSGGDLEQLVLQCGTQQQQHNHMNTRCSCWIHHSLPCPEYCCNSCCHCCCCYCCHIHSWGTGFCNNGYIWVRKDCVSECCLLLAAQHC